MRLGDDHNVPRLRNRDPRDIPRARRHRFRRLQGTRLLHKCGEPFPWTAAAFCAAEELAGELDDLSDDEKESLKKALPDLVRETPRVRLAETRFKKLMKKAGKEGVEGMRGLLTDIISETVRKTLFGA